MLWHALDLLRLYAYIKVVGSLLNSQAHSRTYLNAKNTSILHNDNTILARDAAVLGAKESVSTVKRLKLRMTSILIVAWALQNS
jgi:hypothetical protein